MYFNCSWTLLMLIHTQCILSSLLKHPHTLKWCCVCVLSSAICARFKTRARFWINLYANIWQRQIPSKPKLPRLCTWVMPCLRLPLTVWGASMSRRRGGYLPRFEFSFQIWDLRELKPMEIALNIFRLRPERIANPKQNNENFCTLSQHSGEGGGSKWRGVGGVSGYGHVKHEIQLCLEFELGQKWTPHSKCGAYASAVSWGEVKGE